MKKALVIVIALAMLASLTVVAMAEKPADPVFPGEDDFSTVIALERAQVETSEGLPEQALIENDCAEKRLAALEALANAKDQIGDDEFGQEVLKKLIEYLNGNENNLGLIIADMARDKDNSENAQTAGDVANGIEERAWRLSEIAEDEDMPEGARAGAQRALDNMERAAEKAAWARGEGKDAENDGPPGPPPWAGEKGEENSANSSDVAPKTEENPAEVILPDEASEETPIDEAPPVQASPEGVPDGEDPPEDGPPEGVPADGASTERPAPAERSSER